MPAQASIDTVPELPLRLAEHWEALSAFATANELPAAEWDAFLELLEELLVHPVVLNEASAAELARIPLLDAPRIAALIDYRRRFGPLLSPYELQAVPGWDLTVIRAVLLFVRLSASETPPNWHTALRLGESQLYMRSEWRSRWRGLSPLKSYLRYQFRGGRRIRLGLTAEKDQGEAWWSASSPYGIDFLSAHLELRPPAGKLRGLWLGDYHLRLGQGLLAWTGFAPTYGPDATAIVRAGHPIWPYSSSQESGFLRGLAAQWQVAPSWQLWLFGSSARRDATVCCPPDSLVSFSSFRRSGLHRSEADKLGRDAVKERLVGMRLQHESGGSSFAVNVLQRRYNLPRRPQPRLDNAFQPTGTDLWMASIDGRWLWRNLFAFSEIAIQQRGAAAWTGGLVLTLHRYLRFSVQGRAFSPAFYSEYANPVARWTYAHNERGFYLGVEWRLSTKWVFTAWHDWYRSPWLRYNGKAPTEGTVARLRLTYTPQRHVEWYAEWQMHKEWTTRNDPAAPLAFLQIRQRHQWLAQLSVPLDAAWTWRTRLTLSRYQAESKPQFGMLWYHDLHYRPMGQPFSFTARLALYRTQGYDTRIYAYENDLLYNLSLPAFYDYGARAYLNLRWRPLHALTFEGRIAHTRPLGQALPSRGEEADPLPSWQLKGQIRCKF